MIKTFEQWTTYITGDYEVNYGDKPQLSEVVQMQKNIKNFESSYFHSVDNIDEILDKITKSGYVSLDDSEKAILLNFSKDDEDIHAILVKMNEITKEFKELNKRISVLMASDSEELLNKAKKDWMNLNSKVSTYENMLRYLYKIEDPYPIWNYQKQHGLTASHNLD